MGRRVELPRPLNAMGRGARPTFVKLAVVYQDGTAFGVLVLLPVATREQRHLLHLL